MPARRLWLRFGLRYRLAGIAVLVVGSALVAGALGLVSLLGDRLDNATTTAARLRATDVATLVASGAVPEHLAFFGDESALVQVVDPEGEVVAATDNLRGEAAVTNRRPDRNGSLVSTVHVRSLDRHDEYRVVAVGVPTREGTYVVYAGEALEQNHNTVEAISTLLLAGLPALVALVALVTWWAAGRALRPVKRVSRTLEQITAFDLHRRVPETGMADEIGELTRTVNATLQRLDTAVDRQRRFVADASHELRGPLASLRADLEISIEHPEHTPWSTVVAATLTDVERLQQLTEDLLLLARLDATHAPAHAVVDLAAIASAAADEVLTGVAVERRGLAGGALVTGNRSQLDRLVRNLVANAAAHASGCVTVGIDRLAGVVRLLVSDDGAGISPVDRTRIFEPFVRLDDARTRGTGGTGLGLAIVRDIAAAHHASVDITDTEPHGATFVVTFTAAGRDAGSALEDAPAAIAPIGGAPGLAARR